MKRTNAIAALVGVIAALGSSAALARGDVRWSVSVNDGPVSVTVGNAPVYGPVYVPQPVYTPAPVYVPAPVYAPPPVVVRPYPVYTPAPVYVPAQPVRYRGHSKHWDRDRDGIPDRYDRVFNPPWDRDGDGVPNRRDRHDDRWRDGSHRGGGWR